MNALKVRQEYERWDHMNVKEKFSTENMKQATKTEKKVTQITRRNAVIIETQNTIYQNIF